MAEKLKPKSKEHISIINENVLDTKKHNTEEYLRQQYEKKSA